MSGGHGEKHDHEHDHDHDHDHGHEHEHEHAAPESLKVVAAPAAGQHKFVLKPAQGHVHGPDCGHDHGHDHEHGPGCDHGHAHDHDHGKKEYRPAFRPAEDGGPALQLALADILPGETNEEGRFERFEELLRAHHAIRDAHIRRDLGYDELCVHFDGREVPAAKVLELARAAGLQAGRRYIGKTWFVAGMESPQCAQIIEHSLLRMPGILEASVGVASERLVLEFDNKMTSEARIEGRIEALGYALQTPQAGHVCSHHDHGSGLGPKLEMPLSAAGGLLTALGWGLQHVMQQPAMVYVPVFALAIASGGYFATRGALRSLKQLRVDIESLMVLAALGAAALGAWFEGAFLLFLFSLGHSIEHRAMHRARHAVEALGKKRPTTAQLKRGGSIEEVPVEKLNPGDRIVVRPGDRVPIDGVIRAGQSTLEQAALTGESVPVDKSAGDEVYCGSVNGPAVLDVEVLRPASESMLNRMIDMVAAAEARQGPSQRFARRFEQRVVPWVLGSAVVMPFVLLALGLSLQESLLRMVALLVAASPCALAISTPSAVLSAIAAAARGGVLIKGGVYLESLAAVEVIAFDKTGTLTLGQPRLVSIAPLAGVSEAALLTVAASLEALTSHPIGKAVLAGAQQRGLQVQAVDHCEAVHGRGIKGTLAGEALMLGNLAMFEGIAVPAEVSAEVDRLEQAGQTILCVRRGEKFLGVLGVADTPREGLKQVFAKLKQQGVVRTLMLSGDNARAAKAVAGQVGVDEVHAPLLPQGKVDVLRKLARTRRGAAMIGDGVNDAPALAAATVGVAMGGVGSDVALETADVVLMGDDLHKLPFAMGLARAATRTIRQNLFISLGVAGVLVVASVLGIAGVAESVVFHEGSTLLVVANGLRLLRYKD